MEFWKRRKRGAVSSHLSGKGLEIGALHDPTPVPNAESILYSDWTPPDALESIFPGATAPDIVSDSESFPAIADESFDFVIANHVLEHLTDPIRALKEWHRILRPDGFLMLALPDKRFTFDAKRQRTSLAHLIADHESTEVPEVRNFCHLEEWAEHVVGLPKDSDRYNEWIRRNREAYSVHNHVWVPRDIVDLILWLYHRGARYAFELAAADPTITNEFIFLLRVRKTDVFARQDISAWTRFHRRIALVEPIQTLFSQSKRFVRWMKTFLR